MIAGMETFRDKFKEYSDCYTVIGGAACDILMTNADMEFRATKDIDMILILEDKYQEFAKVFWEYIKEAGYRCGWKNSDEMHFYRFTEPRDGYPVMIELFSRRQGYRLEMDEGIIPIHIDDDTSSLSAILLNDDFYDFMKKGRTIIDGVSVLEPEYLIPFKMNAWLDLKARKEKGEHVNERDLKKHKYDVFRLLQIVTNDSTVETRRLVHDSIKIFLDRIQDEKLPLSQIGLPMAKEEGIHILRNIYDI